MTITSFSRGPLFAAQTLPPGKPRLEISLLATCRTPPWLRPSASSAAA